MQEYKTKEVEYDELGTRQCVYYVSTEKSDIMYHGKISIFNPTVCKMTLIKSVKKSTEGAN